MSMLPEDETTTSVLKSSSSIEDDDSTTVASEDLLSESLFHSCISSFGNSDNNRKLADEDLANSSSCLPDSQSITESRQPQEEAAIGTEAAGAADANSDNSTYNNTAGQATRTSSKPNNNNNDNSSRDSILSASKDRPIIHSITFNRDRTCLVVSTSVGVRIRTLESIQCNNSNNLLTCDVPLLPDGATYSQLLHNTSLLVVIKPSTPRCCYLYNAKNAKFPLAALPLSAAVKRVELTRQVLTALTVDGRVHVFHMAEGGEDITIKNSQRHMMEEKSSSSSRKALLRPTWIQTLNIMHSSDSCRSLTRGMDIFNAGSYFDLSPDEEQPLLVCKSFNRTSGTVRVYDPTIVEEVSIINNHNNIGSNVSVGSGAGSTTSSSWDYYHNNPVKKKKRRIQLLSTINAHEHCVTRMLIGRSGNQSYLATTSSKGTTIRLFGLPRGDFLWEFHRGSRACQFYSLAWNGNVDRLVTYGSSGTIHVFSLPKERDINVTAVAINNDSIEEGDFQHVTDSVARNESVVEEQSWNKASEKSVLRFIGVSPRRKSKSANTTTTTANKPLKHRSFAKLKYKPPTSSPTNKKRCPQTQSIIVSLLDRRNNGNGTIDKNDQTYDEDMLVICSLDGELRQYSVRKDGHVNLAQLEDILS